MSDRKAAVPYRLFRVTAAGRVEAAAEVIPAEDDADAVRRAEVLAGEGRAELWAGARLLARFGSPAPR